MHILDSPPSKQVVKQRGINNFKSIYEADDIIPPIGADLRAPILSSDSDFLIQNLPAGVISVKSLMAGDFAVQTDLHTGRKYMNCEIYKVDALQRKFPGLRSELVPLAGAILGKFSGTSELLYLCIT